MNHPTMSADSKGFPWRALGWSAAAALLLLPLIAMQFTDDVQWTFADFVFAFVLIAGVGAGCELAVRASPNRSYTLGFGVTLAGTFLMIWINAAVGIIGSAANDANSAYVLMLGIGIALGVAGRIRPRAMAWATAATALMQALITAIAVVAGLGQPENSALHLLGINGFFMLFWLVGAVLFHDSVRVAEAGSAA